MWIYKIATGLLTSPSGLPFATGYSGAVGSVDDISKQAVHDIGPIPAGTWIMGEPVDDPKMGEYCIPLSPSPATNTYGRTGFYCHGDLISGPPESASHGCIIMPRFAREAMWANSDHALLTVD